MNIYFDPSGTPAGLQRCLQQAAKEDRIDGLLVLACDSNGFLPADLDPILNGLSLPLIGGIFPRIIAEGRLHERGTIVVGLTGVVAVETICGLSDQDIDYENVLDRKFKDISQVRTMILFVDGFANCIATFIDSLFNVFGLDLNYVGGGAGSLSMVRRPCLLTNRGMVEDCAVLAFLSTPSGIGVCHGYRELAGPFQVTDARNNLIRGIEWQPAFDFYQQVLYEKAGIELSREDFYSTSQHYPFGIARLSGEQIVRDPYMVTDDGSLVCIGEIQEGAFISILQSSERLLVEAAGESLHRSLQALPDTAQSGFCLFVDCVSRTIALGEGFQREIDTVNSTGRPLIGICTIGEIANCGTEYLDFYNKTAVMAVLAEK